MKIKETMGIPEKRTVGTARHSFKGIPPCHAAAFFGIITLILIALLIIPVQAALVNGTYYVRYSPEQPANGTKIFYYNNNTPQNNPREFVVKPGDTIYLGGTYDLSYVMGVSKQFAWWQDWKYESTDCSPDIVNTVSYILTNGRINPKMVYIDPEQYKVGNWWQWDGCYIDRNDLSGTTHWLPYKADNNLAFRIIYPPVWPKPTPTIEQIFTLPPTPIKTVITTPTINITPMETPVIDSGGMPWYFWAVILGAIILIVIFILVM
jgi:hypothetical protein